VRADGDAAFDDLVRLARAAEAAALDFVIVSPARPDTLVVLAALAGATDRVGLVGSVDPDTAQPFELARQLATLDHLSDGRAGWNLVNSADELVAVTQEFWGSWGPGAVPADRDSGVYADPAHIHEVAHRGPSYDVRGFATLPAGPQGHPVLFHDAEVAFSRDLKQRKVFSELTIEQVGADPTEVADLVTQSDEYDGFIVAAGDFDAFVATVVPLLVDNDDFRAVYAGRTLRDHLGL
jgi:hypothetical protein